MRQCNVPTPLEIQGVGCRRQQGRMGGADPGSSTSDERQRCGTAELFEFECPTIEDELFQYECPAIEDGGEGIPFILGLRSVSEKNGVLEMHQGNACTPSPELENTT